MQGRWREVVQTTDSVAGTMDLSLGLKPGGHSIAEVRGQFLTILCCAQFGGQRKMQNVAQSGTALQNIEHDICISRVKIVVAGEIYFGRPDGSSLN